MGNNDSLEYLLLGMLIGGAVGFLAGLLLSKHIEGETASVVFERDDKGRITAIHYVRGVRVA